MERSTLFGLLAGGAVLVYGMASGGKLPSYFHIPSLILTVGGGLVSTIVTVSPETLAQAVHALPKMLFDRPADPIGQIRQLITLSQKARREGLLALESNHGLEDDPFAAKALEMVVDGVEGDTIRKAMTYDLDNLHARHQTCIGLFKSMATYFPAWGMIGTLVGLISLLQSLDDPSMIGASMAVAMITTFYGSVLANFFALPVAGRLAEKSRNEARLKEMVMEAVLGIQVGTNPRILEHTLLAFLSPAQRAAYEKSQQPAAAADADVGIRDRVDAAAGMTGSAVRG